MTEIEGGPPPREIQVAVPGDLVLLREHGLLVWAGAFTVSAAGFAFALRIMADAAEPGIQMPQPFALYPSRRDHETWLNVRFADGRSCDADIGGGLWSADGRDLRVEFLFGDESTSDGRADSRWWVSPLPPPGPVELTIHLNGRAGPRGAATLDATALLAGVTSEGLVT